MSPQWTAGPDAQVASLLNSLCLSAVASLVADITFSRRQCHSSALLVSRQAALAVLLCCPQWRVSRPMGCRKQCKSSLSCLLCSAVVRCANECDISYQHESLMTYSEEGCCLLHHHHHQQRFRTQSKAASLRSALLISRKAALTEISAVHCCRKAALAVISALHSGKPDALNLQGLMLELSLLTSLRGCSQLCHCSYLLPQFCGVGQYRGSSGTVCCWSLWPVCCPLHDRDCRKDSLLSRLQG